jgi:hypothetical protein
MNYVNAGSSDPVMRRLMEVLNIPSNATKATLCMDPGQLVTLSVTRLVTTEELEALADAYITEGLQLIPTCSTQYHLKRRPATEPPSP